MLLISHIKRKHKIRVNNNLHLRYLVIIFIRFQPRKDAFLTKRIGFCILSCKDVVLINNIVQCFSN